MLPLPFGKRAGSVSILDRFGGGFTLVCRDGADGTDILDAASAHNIPIASLDLAGDGGVELYPCPLTLARPDGHVAWRGENMADADNLWRIETGRQGDQC